MRIFHSRWAEWTHKASKCLTIGSYCALCSRLGLPDMDLCAQCLAHFRLLQHADRQGNTTSLCLSCGGAHPAQRMGSEPYCTECAGQQGQFLRRILAPYRYAFPVDKLVKRLKYQDERQLARVFGTLLANAARQTSDNCLPDVLLPMPLHPSRFQARGYNQAQDIARWSGRHLGVRVASGQVRRIVDTGSLAGLSRPERQHRILGAFRASDALSGKRVAIVDDVLTTGASARELAREIYDSGADSVELWVFARTSSSRRVL